MKAAIRGETPVDVLDITEVELFEPCRVYESDCSFFSPGEAAMIVEATDGTRTVVNFTQSIAVAINKINNLTVTRILRPETVVLTPGD